MTEQISAARRDYRFHLARMWAERHEPNTRSSIRDNIRGQRGWRAFEATGRATMVTVVAGTAQEAGQ